MRSARRTTVTRSRPLLIWVWRLLMWFGIAMIVLGFRTSQGWEPVPPDTVSDPAHSQSLAAAMLDSAAVSRIAGQPMTLLRDWLPETALITRQAPLAVDLRRALVDQAWQRMWVNPGTRETMSEVMIRYNSHKANHETPNLCTPTSAWNIPGAAVAGPLSDDPWQASGCLRADVGHLAIWVHASAKGPASNARVKALLQDTLAAQLQSAADSPDRAISNVFDATRNAILRGYLLALAGITFLSAFRGLLSDKSSWQALLAWRRPRQLPPGAVDLTGATRYRRTKLHAVGVLRFAALVWTARLAEVIFADPQETLLLLGVTFVVGILAQRFAMDGTLRSVKLAKMGWPGRLATLGGAGASGLIVAVAGFLWTLGNSAGSIGVAPTVPDWFVARQALLFQWFAVLLLLLAVAPLSVARRLAMRTITSHPPDPRGAALLLRNFSDDYLELRVRQVGRASLLDQLLLRRRSRFEEIEAFTLAQDGRVLAVGKPGEWLPPGIGAARLYFGDDWREKVELLMVTSRLIVLNLGRSESLAWETQRLTQLDALHKTVFVMPPVAATEQRLRLAALAQACRIPWHQLEMAMSGRHVLAVVLPRSGELPLVAVSATQDDISYDVAFRTCSLALNATDPEAVAALMGPSSATRRLAADDTLTMPPVTVLPASEAKRKRRFWQKPWPWVVVLQLLVTPVLIPWLVGDPIATRDARTTVYLADGHKATIALGGSVAAAYGVADDRTIVGIDFSASEPQDTIHVIGTLPRSSNLVRLVDGIVFWVSLQDSTLPGQVGAWSIAEARNLWTQDLPPGMNALTVDTDSVFVTSSSENTLTAFDRRKGTPTRTGRLPCQPWQPSVAEGSVWVACPAESYVLRIDPRHLSVIDRPAVMAGTFEVISYNKQLFAMNLPQRDLLPLHEPGSSFGFTKDGPAIDATDSTLAVEGYERVSIFRGDSVDRRQLMESAQSIAVIDSGDVLVASGSSFILLRVH